MKLISVRTICWSATILVAIAVLYLLVLGSIERLNFSNKLQTPAAVPIVRNKIPVDEKPQSVERSGEGRESVEPANSVTRTFFKPSDAQPSEAVRLEVKAVEKNNELAISGNLLDGSTCGRLQVELQLKSTDGREVFHTLILGATGRTGERPIRSMRRLPPTAGDLPVTWNARVRSVRCLDP